MELVTHYKNKNAFLKCAGIGKIHNTLDAFLKCEGIHKYLCKSFINIYKNARRMFQMC